MRTDFIRGLSNLGFHKVFFTEFGDPSAKRTVICVHGLTRNCRDFDDLAQALAADFRVVCPDVVGRGRSDWLEDKHGYNYAQYLADMNALLAHVSVRPQVSGFLARVASQLFDEHGERSIYWVGTSMGGILGMLLAAMPNTPISKLVVNDVGPFIPHQALERIASYVGTDVRFDTFEALEAHIRQVSAPFGPLTDAQWRHLTTYSAKQFDDGKWGMLYDPGISVTLRESMWKDVDLWEHWDKITCPTLVLRGADSDLLLKPTADDMQKRGPRCKLVEFAGIGHAPMLMSDDQIKLIKDFLA